MTTTILRGKLNAESPYIRSDDEKSRRRSRGLGLCACCFAAALISAVALAGESTKISFDAFRHKCVITVAGYAGSETLVNFPLLLRVAQGSPIYAAAATDGSDIRFADGEGNLLAHEIETWNADGESLIWVKVPALAGRNTQLTLYCGAVCLDALEVPKNDFRDVWSSAGYRGVWHFTGSASDSSPNDLKGSISMPPPTFSEVGVVGTAFHGEGSSYVNYSVVDTNKWAGYDGNALTVSAWIKTEDATGYGRILSCKSAYDKPNGFELTQQGTVRKVNAVGANSNQNSIDIGTSFENEFVYITAVYKDGDSIIYANGVEKQVKDWNAPLTMASQALSIGANSYCQQIFHGWIDELRLQWAAQSADWVAADYASQSAKDFAVLGELEDNAAYKLDVSSFGYRCSVTFSGYDGVSSLENFPALVRIPASAGIAARCFTNGSDIRFVDAEGFLVPHEIDTWSPTGETLIWVRVPKLSGRNTKLTMYYRGRPTQGVSSRAVWGATGYKGVWHFSGSSADSSPNNLASTVIATPTFDGEGVVGCAYGNAADNSCLEIANDLAWASYDGKALTVSAWAKTTVATSYGRIISCKKGNSNIDDGFELQQQGAANRVNAVGSLNAQGTGLNQNAVYLPSPLSLEGDYVYLTAVYSNGTSFVYANGSLVGSKTWENGILKPAEQVLHIGRAVNYNNTFYGNIDEVRLQWNVQSPEWIAADYATQHKLDFAVLGTPEALKGLVITVR